jgi:hypothetical protein
MSELGRGSAALLVALVQPIAHRRPEQFGPGRPGASSARPADSDNCGEDCFSKNCKYTHFVICFF